MFTIPENLLVANVQIREVPGSEVWKKVDGSSKVKVGKNKERFLEIQCSRREHPCINRSRRDSAHHRDQVPKFDLKPNAKITANQVRAANFP